MVVTRIVPVRFFLFLLFTVVAVQPSLAAEALASWNDGVSKQSIMTFVERVTDQDSPDFIPVSERIAVFDNDGTLWSEQPFYFQLFFAIDRIKAMAPAHPEWQQEEPYASLIKGDIEKALAGGKEALLKIVVSTHAGVTAEEFRHNVQQWLQTARHPKTQKPYTGMVYQPMLELLDYLRENDFKTFIVSGGGIDFLRVFAEEVYGIPPEQVVGSSIKAKYEVRDGKPVMVKLGELDFVDDKEGKPVGIHQHIGRRPVFAAGNSDGDFQMLEWTTGGESASLGLIVHHTDGEREWAYDRKSVVGQLNRGLDEAKQRGWLLVDMKKDWRVVYPPAK